MDAILADAAQLNDVLLATDEGEYDNIALHVLQALRKYQLPDQTILITVRRAPIASDWRLKC